MVEPHISTINMNYSHILSIKVVNLTKRNENIEKIVKEQFLNSCVTYNDIPIIWNEIEWKFPQNQFDIGNIVTLSPISVDNYILLAVKKTLNQIENLLKLNGTITNEIIIFNITKPLVNSIILQDTTGLII
jgi:hypothetical protein